MTFINRQFRPLFFCDVHASLQDCIAVANEFREKDAQWQGLEIVSEEIGDHFAHLKWKLHYDYRDYITVNMTLQQDEESLTTAVICKAYSELQLTMVSIGLFILLLVLIGTLNTEPYDDGFNGFVCLSIIIGMSLGYYLVGQNRMMALLKKLEWQLLNAEDELRMVPA